MKFNHKKSLMIAVALAIVLVASSSQVQAAVTTGTGPAATSVDTRNMVLKTGAVPPRPELQAQRQQINDLRTQNQGIRTDLKAGVQGEREDFRMQVGEMRDQMKNASGTVRQDMRGMMKDNRREMMERVKSMRQEAFTQIFQNNVQKMNGLGNILTQAYARLSTLLKQRETAGKDVTEAKKLLAEADTLIKKAQADIAAFKAFKPGASGTTPPQRPASGTPSGTDGPQIDLEKPRTLAQNVRTSIEAAHQALRKVAISLGVGGGNDNKPANGNPTTGSRPSLPPRPNAASGAPANTAPTTGTTQPTAPATTNTGTQQ